MRRVVVVTALVGLVTLLVTVPPAAGAPDRAPAAQEARVDFNDDGFADLAVGAPGEDIGAAVDAGALNVLYGSDAGLEPSADVFYQGAGGAGGSLEDGDRLGSAVAKGDFNGDGIFDLAVGAPGETVGTDGAAGAVNVLNGSSGGLTGGGSLFTQSNAETGDEFGAALAAADLNDDGIFDLAIGAPGEDVGTTGNAGAVTVLLGSPAGLTTAGSQTLFQGGGAGGNAEAGDGFGAALATGILGGDGIADLVVGVPGEDVGLTENAGAVNLLAGSPGGLAIGALVTQGNPETLDNFGAAVATGDFDDTDGDDVAAGAPGETVNGNLLAGAVSVFNGPPSGLANERLLFQGTAGIPGSPESFDQFGAAVAPTDSNGIDQWDLAIGAPGEDLGPDANAGAVNLLAGSTTGPGGGTLLTQANPEDFDNFGAGLSGGFFLHDFDLNGFHDLAVGAPGETVGAGAAAAGAVSVFYGFGGPGGTVTPGPAFTQGPGGLGGAAETGDALGVALE